MAFLFYNMKKHIPNTITCLNLFSGCIGILMVLKGDYTAALYCVLASGLFDFFDGMVARALHVKSTIGKELDSLADVISFGLLPGMVIYSMLRNISDNEYLPLAGFLISIFSALRLAKFNVDERQTTDFIGVNTPMNTFLIISLPFISEVYPTVFNNVFVLIGITIVSSLLLVSEIKLFSMKLNSLAWNASMYKYLFLIVAFVLVLFLQVLAVPLIFLLYIVFSIMHFRKEGNH